MNRAFIRRAWLFLATSAFVASVAAQPAAPPPARLLAGRVTVAGGGADGRELADAVILFRTAAPQALRPLADGTTMSMRDKAFDPRVLVVTPGTTVRFPNVDPIIHNAFSTSARNAFDLGFYAAGAERTWRFEQPGVVRVFCNVHHAMIGYVLVADTAHHVRPAADGAFQLALPPGAGELMVWHPRSEPWRLKLAADAPLEPVAVALRLTRAPVPAHFNKHGKPYAAESARNY